MEKEKLKCGFNLWLTEKGKKKAALICYDDCGRNDDSLLYLIMLWILVLVIFFKSLMEKAEDIIIASLVFNFIFNISFFLYIYFHKSSRLL